MKHIHKEYEYAFLLEPTKLTRIVDKIHARLAEQDPTVTHDSFEVFLSRNRRDEMTSLEEVLKLENSRREKIQRLLITCSGGRKVAARLEHEIQIDFGGKKTRGTSETKVVAVDIRSDAAGWASSTLSELEEQLERTRLQYFQPLLALALLLLGAFLALGSQFIVFGPPPAELGRGMWLRDSDLDRVAEILSQNRTINDEEMKEIATRQLRNVLKDQRPEQLPRKVHTRHIMSVAIPLLVIIACGATLLFTCYPRAVFLWGDETERFAKMLQMRKTLWGIIIGIMIVGVLSNLLFAGAVSWLPAEQGAIKLLSVQEILDEEFVQKM